MDHPSIEPQYNHKDDRLHPDIRPQAELSIVIGTRNRKDLLRKCLNSLIGKIKINHQIIVIDAGSTDGTTDDLKNMEGIHLVCDGKPIGQAQSYNRVFNSLSCRYICWLSDDNIVQPGILDSAISILKKNNEIGMVALKVKDFTGRLEQLDYIGGIRKTGILNCNQGVIRSDLFQKIGFFDEKFKNYGIDCDVTAKVLLSGRRIAFTKEIGIHHYRDHDSESGAISKVERAKGRELVDQKYYAKYAYLIDGNLATRLKMCMKRLIWRVIKSLNKRIEKKCFKIEKITGKNMRDWRNLMNGRYISIFDFFRHRKHPYYLEQCMPKEILLSDKNPYKSLIP
jgi:GT2 family glycosyltransferase